MLDLWRFVRFPLATALALLPVAVLIVAVCGVR